MGIYSVWVLSRIDFKREGEDRFKPVNFGISSACHWQLPSVCMCGLHDHAHDMIAYTGTTRLVFELKRNERTLELGWVIFVIRDSEGLNGLGGRSSLSMMFAGLMTN